MRGISDDEAKRLANEFCGKNSISSFKKREALAVLLVQVFFAGYEAALDDLVENMKAKEHGGRP
jgi:hypothetical protein